MAYQKRGNCLKSTKMIVKFRESTIARLEGKVKEEKEEQIVSNGNDRIDYEPCLVKECLKAFTNDKDWDQSFYPQSD